MAACSAPWRDYLSHMVLDKYVGQYGADGMYLDGIGLVTYECKNLRHGHGYGEWHHGLTTWLTHITRRAQELRPGAVFAGEGMNDVDHRYLDVGLFYLDNDPEVYRYTFPWNIGIILGAPSSYLNLEFPALFGLKFGGIDSTFEQHPEKTAEIVAFREKFSQFQFRARFVDDVGLHIADADVKAKLYVRDEPGTRGALVVAFNEQEKEGVSASVDASRVGSLKSAWFYDIGGALRRLDVREENGEYRFALPASRLSAVLLLERCEPFIYIKSVPPVVPGETGRARVTVTNLEAGAIAGKVSLGLPDGWRSEAADFRIPGGGSAEFELAFQVPEGTKYDVYDIYAVSREAGRETKKCIPMGVCRPVQAEIYYVAHDTVRVEMDNSSSREVTGTCRLEVPAPVTVTENDIAFRLAPKGKGSLLFHMRNVDRITTREHIKAVLDYGKKRTVAYELIQPTVLNGGFEQCTAGDGYPDYWNYRRPQSLYLKGVALDKSTYVEGTQSVRLDPCDKSNTNYISTTLIQLVPKTRYRFSCSIRRTGNHGGIGARLFSMYAMGGKGAVDIHIGYKKEGPTGVWERFDGEFTSAEIDVPYQILLNNAGKSPETAWFDDVRIEQIQ